MGRKAVFIDRDGTINTNFGYITDPNDFKMYPGVAEGIKLLKEKGFKIIIITNQSGIARGYLSKEKLKEIHEKMTDELFEKGTSIDAIYYCPHHPDDKCDCRKPNYGLIKRAVKDLDIDTRHSYIIGDRMLDVEAGHNAGLKTVLVPEDKEKIEKEKKESNVKPDYSCDDFYTGTLWITKDK